MIKSPFFRPQDLPQQKFLQICIIDEPNSLSHGTDAGQLSGVGEPSLLTETPRGEGVYIKTKPKPEQTILTVAQTSPQE